MAYLLEKKVKGHSYWVIVQSKREGKKVRQEIVEYIGDNKKLFERLTNTTTKQVEDVISIKSYSHGAAYALYKIACFLHIPEILDEKLPSRTRNGVSRSTSILLAAIHRAINPDSKMAFADWFKTTSLPYYLDIKPELMTSQHFWEQMDCISYENLIDAEDTITAKILEIFPVEVEKLSLDYTNYYTYIDTENKRCELAQRGHNKQKRYDLRQCSLAILALKDFAIPLFSKIYAGNINDITEFAKYTQSLKSRLPKQYQQNITLVFDGGSNTKSNLNKLGMHYICSFSMNICKEFYEIPINEYQEIQLKNKIVKAYRLNKEIWLEDRECILTYSKSLYNGQYRELEEDIEKYKIELDKINKRLRNPKSRIKRDVEELQKICNSKLKGKHIKNILKINISQEVINYEVDEKEKKNIADKYFGKKLTITDRTNWTTEAILETYYDQDCIEKIFRDTKNNDRGCMQPIYHWTDQKIKTHMYICLLAQTLMGMLQKLMIDAGIDISKEKMMDELELIRESWVKDMIFNENQKTGKVKRQLEEMSPKQKSLWEVVQKIES